MWDGPRAGAHGRRFFRRESLEEKEDQGMGCAGREEIVQEDVPVEFGPGRRWLPRVGGPGTGGTGAAQGKVFRGGDSQGWWEGDGPGAGAGQE